MSSSVAFKSASLVSEPAPTLDLAGKVDATPLQREPFDYIYMEDVFSPGQYRQMLDALPQRRSYHELRHKDALRADGTSTRFRLYLYPEDLVFLPSAQRKVWMDISRALLSKQLQNAFKRKFRGALESRFGKNVDKLDFYPIPILVRDLPGYKIGIHSDSLNKAMTIQFYLPHDASQKSIGTIFHDGNEGPALAQTKTMGFMPATGYAFAVTKRKSWHSVATTTEEDGERNSLMLTYYLQDNSRKWLRWRVNRAKTFFGYPPSH